MLTSGQTATVPEDVALLGDYIKAELNVLALTVSNDASKYHVQLKVEPKTEILGPRLQVRIRVSVCPSVCLSVCLSVCQFVCLWLKLYTCVAGCSSLACAPRRRKPSN